jgi:hypothetical protein
LEVLDIVGLRQIEALVEYDPLAMPIIIETLKEKYDEIGIDGIRDQVPVILNDLEALKEML